MSSRNTARTSARRTRSTAALAVSILVAAAVAVTVIVLGSPSPASFLSATPDLPALSDLTGGSGSGSGEPSGADGSVPDGVTVFDDDVPAVANLDPALLDALRLAAGDAAADGVTFIVNSGWRSPEYQDQLLREAIAEYGSAAEAARWVATASTSPHVQGDAIDVGQSDATDWLAQHGSAYGLCQIYANESWHYELRPEAVDDGCPATYADPTFDPRMQQ